MSGMDRSGGERRRVGMVAVAWFVRMRSPDRTPEQELSFRAWLAEDERHAQAYAGIARSWESVSDLDTLPGFVAVHRQARQRRPGVVATLLKPLRARAGRFALPRPYGRPAWSMAAAAAVALTVAAGSIGAAWVSDSDRARTFRTEAGERMHRALSDGSAVVLTARSELSINMSATARKLVLNRGQAFFDVASDPSRPFRVEAGGGTVTAVGTQFDVNRLNDAVVVTVFEGIVDVVAPNGREVRIVAGERVSFDRNGLEPVGRVDIERAIAWRDGRISVVDAPLIEVIDEMNRHSRRKLKVDRSDAKLGRLLISGQFKIDRPELIVQYLRANGHLVWVAKDAGGNLTMRLQSGPERR